MLTAVALLFSVFTLNVASTPHPHAMHMPTKYYCLWCVRRLTPSLFSHDNKMNNFCFFPFGSSSNVEFSRHDFGARAMKKKTNYFLGQYKTNACHFVMLACKYRSHIRMMQQSIALWTAWAQRSWYIRLFHWALTPLSLANATHAFPLVQPVPNLTFDYSITFGGST